MKSSDQRYRQVQRVKRDTSGIQAKQEAIPAAISAVRYDPGQIVVHDGLVRDTASEFTHLLLACGRTASDFRRNFRRGAASWNVVAANDLAPMEDLKAAKLDGFSVLRLSREQVRTVRAKWRKLRDQDFLTHDPQGALWINLMRSNLLGDCNALGALQALRDGEQPSMARFDGDDEAKYAWFRERELSWRPKANEPFPARYAEETEDEASICFSMALADYHLKWRKTVAEPQPRIRERMERNLVVAEAFMDADGFSKAYWNPETSGRHCSEARLRERFDRVNAAYGDKWREIIEAQREGWS
ncbi:hypothetical protein [Novosphingobium guangzhouense]|uniref:Uncharacterized protein n=1 Tax=Novosphingobium guangzhouense TaxID=1850347 RepID=A0A2K2G0N1_9SPHN|nr:hypothetical protein [Novosphingobium guangzhouense]PNU04601.1 hypothetical protein A8V01_19525 [Novosphingobium guangzhouense]